ncbi:AAA family ATPase [Actinomadura opuntiae]|uniref:AAA family ATPase n=1 Tax=Actinomadura sp. OS1-43 TaxID=604315 RepID=UPI00333ED9F7
MLTTLAVENYRSLRQLVLPLTQLNRVTGANGTGKSSLYRALRVLANASGNGVVAAVARDVADCRPRSGPAPKRRGWRAGLCGAGRI